MKRVLFFLAVMCLALPACQSIQVVDNTYGPMGGQYVKVSDAFEYLGSPKVHVKSFCVNDCPTGLMDTSKTRADVFARRHCDRVAEFCVIERVMLSGHERWIPEKGDMVTYADNAYVEEWGFLTDDETKRFKLYLNYLQSLGYGTAAHGMVVRILIRNVSKTSKIVMYYGCSLNLIPGESLEDVSKVKAYVVDLFDKRIQFVKS